MPLHTQSWHVTHTVMMCRLLLDEADLACATIGEDLNPSQDIKWIANCQRIGVLEIQGLFGTDESSTN